MLNFSKRKRRIDLSMKSLLEKPEAEEPAYDPKDLVEIEEEDDQPAATAMEIAFRAAMGDDMPLPRKQKKTKRRGKKNKHRDQQEDWLNRTLQTQDS